MGTSTDDPLGLACDPPAPLDPTPQRPGSLAFVAPLAADHSATWPLHTVCLIFMPLPASAPPLDDSVTPSIGEHFFCQSSNASRCLPWHSAAQPHEDAKLSLSVKWPWIPLKRPLAIRKDHSPPCHGSICASPFPPQSLEGHASTHRCRV